MVWDNYSSGKPRTIYYFDNKDDLDQFPTLYITAGSSVARKPIPNTIEKYYENGILQSRGQNIGDIKCGRWEYFYENGIPQARCYYRKGISKDTVYGWYPSGKLKRLLVEVDTIQHYWHGLDYLEDGSKIVECNLTKDSGNNWLFNGDWKSWYHNGKQSFQATMKDNWTAGKWQEWDSAGNKHEGQKPINITL